MKYQMLKVSIAVLAAILLVTLVPVPTNVQADDCWSRCATQLCYSKI